MRRPPFASGVETEAKLFKAGSTSDEEKTPAVRIMRVGSAAPGRLPHKPREAADRFAEGRLRQTRVQWVHEEHSS